ncbi:hypothetical protein BDN72DRAFT_913361 [Pluteus cervinus]|uniref:Uncharacterized protein n=1 Tax=Pluteus cervinus TaxID=181527 RepID=A0ACD3AQ91_9AGAR|nr:hypothetical protein BDN72DRAFT_913361 [Pluteus cervinus]
MSPMTMINTSGTCATTRLVQCRGFGTYMNDISRKFDNDPEDVPDLTKADFLARKKVFHQVMDWAESRPNGEEWIPILYAYEIVRASAKREAYWGHMVFIDTTTTRFLLVMVFPSTCDCGNYSHHDYDALTQYHAHRLMSLANYIYHYDNKPNWVRATYTTTDHDFKLDPAFLDGVGSLRTKIEQEEKTEVYPVYNITADNFTPSLLESDLEKINNITLHSGWWKRPSEEVKQKVLGDKSARPELSATWKQRNPRLCSHCNVLKDKSLMLCSKCKLVYYCVNLLRGRCTKKYARRLRHPVSVELRSNVGILSYKLYF